MLEMFEKFYEKFEVYTKTYLLSFSFYKFVLFFNFLYKKYVKNEFDLPSSGVISFGQKAL